MNESAVQHHAFIDRFSVFDGMVTIEGWVFAPGRVLKKLELLVDGDRAVVVPAGRPSDDVVAVFGAAAAGSRFGLRTISGQSDETILQARLRATFADGAKLLIEKLGERDKGDEPVHRIFIDFLNGLHATEPGRFVEIGSRARSGIVRKQFVPPGWDYAGLDIIEGPNVDVVGDAHQLSKLFEPSSVRAVMAISVLEHILMPWKFAIELNRVLEPGGVAFFLTHQTWALHDVPWDFWRFSSEAWPALFNRHTGFEIVAARMGEPAYIVPRRCAPGTFGPYSPGYLASAVMVRKTGDTALRWDVDVDDVIATAYPQTVTAAPGS
jgi:hypothetical protein